MKILRRSALALMLALGFVGSATAADYGLPDGIQEGNILHCFDWTFNDIVTELPNIAAAGFGAVQVSPVQGNCANNAEWFFAYMPYDFVFKANGNGSRAQLKTLCEKAAEYNIKIIVDVVANHVNQASGYHDTWWDSNGRVRWNGGINYGDRYSITHGQLGDYGDVNSESSEVQARAKAFVEDLKSLGVKGIRWDAAKHIGLPSEGCNFWSTVTSVPGMYHYGEILDNPGGNGNALMKEYTKYMSVTDNGYSNNCRNNDGVPGSYAGWASGTIDDSKVVYWAESHDDYSNEWQASTHVSQAQIDRAWAIGACRKGASALYFSRPSATTRTTIRMGQKGSLQFKQPQIAEVNKFRNIMTGKADYFSQNGSVASVTRKDGGAVIVKKGGGGQISIDNGGGYCPTGTYKDRVSGGTFTVTASTITGTVGASGIAVIYNDGVTPDPNPNPNPDPEPDPRPGTLTITGDYNLAYSGSMTNVHYWGGASQSTWPGVAMTTVTGSDGNTYKVAKVAEGTTGIVFNGNNGQTADLTYTGTFVMNDNGATSTAVTFSNGTNPNPEPDPEPQPNPDGVYVYVDGWDNVYCYIYKEAGGEVAKWPGTQMSKDAASGYWSFAVPDAFKTGSKVIINTGTNGSNRYPADMQPGMDLNGKSMIFRTSTSKWEEYSGGNVTDPTKPVVTADPASGTKFTDNVTVKLTVSPAATIYYTVNGSTPTTSSTVYSAPITLTETTTLKTLAVTSEGAQQTQTFTYTKRGVVVDPTPGTNLITNYYKVNPNGQCGSNRTVNMKFTKLNNDNRMCVADNALSNWTDADLIAQGVARDCASAIRGRHEYPCVDSYAIYAAYDASNLYLGVQYVYSTWDLYGDGILTNGAAKPYNMDGRLMIAFDLDPEVSFSGVLANGNTIWDADGQYNTFDNGTDCIWLGSTKSTVGTPGLFFPDANGKASYDSQYCVGLDAPFYGCQDGLLPSITEIWAPEDFGYDPEILKGNEGFVNIKGLCPDNQHTFYEWKFPLAKLGITESQIKNEGIGVMVIDTYGQGAVGCTPYDPTIYDNANTAYSKDESSSAEKEDKDVFTYAHARIGKIKTSGVINVADFAPVDTTPVYYTLQGVRVANPSNGIYIVRRGNKVTKEIVR